MTISEQRKVAQAVCDAALLLYFRNHIERSDSESQDRLSDYPIGDLFEIGGSQTAEFVSFLPLRIGNVEPAFEDLAGCMEADLAQQRAVPGGPAPSIAPTPSSSRRSSGHGSWAPGVDYGQPGGPVETSVLGAPAGGDQQLSGAARQGPTAADRSVIRAVAPESPRVRLLLRADPDQRAGLLGVAQVPTAVFELWDWKETDKFTLRATLIQLAGALHDLSTIMMPRFGVSGVLGLVLEGTRRLVEAANQTDTALTVQSPLRLSHRLDRSSQMTTVFTAVSAKLRP